MGQAMQLQPLPERRHSWIQVEQLGDSVDLLRSRVFIDFPTGPIARVEQGEERAVDLP
jgi:hypothetical protein